MVTGVAPRDASQIKALSYGALRWHHRNQLIIDRLLERPLRARDKVLEALLSVGLFQLVDARQPEYAAVSATVDASKQLKKPRASGLINAALRRFQRERDAILDSVLAEEEGRFSHPQWLIDRLRSDWPNHWEDILTKAQEHPAFWIRINRTKHSREDYADRLERELQIGATRPATFEDALRLDRAVSVTELPGFYEGHVSVQDAASQLAADFLGPEPGMRILDACAAPGGKATHLLERTCGQIRLVAVDVDAERTELLRSNLDRIEGEAIVITDDVQKTDSWFDGELFDRILIDAPCSATGVIRRHPDIKYLRRPGDIESLAQGQRTLLTKLWPLLKPGGRLLYSTCSILKQENFGVVGEFLKQRVDAREIRPMNDERSAVFASIESPGYQLLPGASETDGFYYALIERLPA